MASRSPRNEAIDVRNMVLAAYRLAIDSALAPNGFVKDSQLSTLKSAMKKPRKISVSKKGALQKRSRVSQVVSGAGLEAMQDWRIAPGCRFPLGFVIYL